MFVSEKFQSLSNLLIRVRNDQNESFQPLLGDPRESIKEAVGVETGGPERQAASSKLSLDTRMEFFVVETRIANLGSLHLSGLH